MGQDRHSTTGIRQVNAPFRLFEGLIRDVHQMWLERAILLALIRAEFYRRYNGAFFGWMWALGRPLALLAVYTLVVGVFLGVGDVIPDFGIYLYLGLITWTFFASLITGSIMSLETNRHLLGRLNFRRELVVLASFCSAAIDFGLQAMLLPLAWIFYGAFPNAAALSWFGLGLPVVVLLGLALGMWLSAANLRYRDIRYLTDVVLQIGFWSVPILYSYGMVRDSLSEHTVLLWFYSANPMVPAVNASRLAAWPASDSPTAQIALMSQNLTLWLLCSYLFLGALGLIASQRYFSYRISRTDELS